MRRRWIEICLSLVVAGVIAASGSGGASASETYVCADGRTLKIDHTNRAKLADDPCIKAWFAQTAPKPKPKPATPEAAATEPPSPLKRQEPRNVRVLRYTSGRRVIVD
jgi:hypothetical protein